MIPVRSRALVATRRSDDRLRRALERLDALTQHRIAAVAGQAGEAAADVVEHTVARVEDRARAALGASAWLFLGAAVGVGLLLARSSRR